MLNALTTHYRAWRTTHYATARTWHTARTWTDLTSLTTQWLRDPALTYHPVLRREDHRDPAHLAHLSEAGFLLLDYQHHTETEHRGYRDRAAITGLVANPTLHTHLRTTAAQAGLIAHTTSPDGIPVTLHHDQAHAWYGRTEDPDDLLWTWDPDHLLHPTTRQALLTAQPLTLASPHYGPTPQLWDLATNV